MMGTNWLTNPLTNRMVEPLTILLLVMFGAAALALLVLDLDRERAHAFK